MIFNILKYSIGSLFYGGLITVLFIALFVFLIKGWYKDAVFKPISFVVLGILSLIILWNSTIICGALAMKSDITSFQTMIESSIASLGLSLSAVADQEISNEVFKEVVDSHPILNYYANSCDFSGWHISELPSVMGDTLKSYLNGIILKSLLWSLGFVVVAAIIVIKTMGRRTNNRRLSSGNRGSRNNDRASRNGGRARVSSRSTGRRVSSRN